MKSFRGSLALWFRGSVCCGFSNGHEGCKYYTVPKTNTQFWQDKVKRNQSRDIEVQHKLAEMGWHSITIWECELKPKKKEQTLKSLIYTLNKIYLNDRTVIHTPYELPEDDMGMAAEEIERQ